MFCIIPFVDYTPEAGPCAAVPGSYHKTTILPSDGRVHQVDAGQVPVRVYSFLFLLLASLSIRSRADDLPQNGLKTGLKTSQSK